MPPLNLLLEPAGIPGRRAYTLACSKPQLPFRTSPAEFEWQRVPGELSPVVLPLAEPVFKALKYLHGGADHCAPCLGNPPGQPGIFPQAHTAQGNCFVFVVRFHVAGEHWREKRVARACRNVASSHPNDPRKAMCSVASQTCFCLGRAGSERAPMNRAHLRAGSCVTTTRIRALRSAD